MMNELLAGVEVLKAQERVRADAANSSIFHSNHEAYGVIAEELSEMMDEANALCEADAMLLRAIRYNDNERFVRSLKSVCGNAKRLAAEAIQVAAMCEKAVYSIGAKEGECKPSVDPMIQSVAKRNRDRYDFYARGDWGKGEQA